jgi:hypothetical protein
MFADDTTLLLTGDPNKIKMMIDLIEKDIPSVKQWLVRNKLQLNAAKTECIVLGSPSSVTKVGEINIVIDGSVITSKESVKLLGFHIDAKLTWSIHIKILTRKCYAQLRPLRMIQPHISQESMQILVKSFVLSNLNSMVALWDSADQIHLKNIEKIVKSAARLVLNKRSSDPISKHINEDLMWLMPSSLYQKTLLTMMYKLVNSDHAPEYFHENLKQVSQFHGYETRQSTKIHVPVKPKSNIVSRSFFFRAINLWNSLPREQTEVPYAVFCKNVTFKLLSEQ